MYSHIELACTMASQFHMDWFDMTLLCNLYNARMLFLQLTLSPIGFPFLSNAVKLQKYQYPFPYYELMQTGLLACLGWSRQSSSRIAFSMFQVWRLNLSWNGLGKAMRTHEGWWFQCRPRYHSAVLQWYWYRYASCRKWCSGLCPQSPEPPWQGQPPLPWTWEVFLQPAFSSSPGNRRRRTDPRTFHTKPSEQWSMYFTTITYVQLLTILTETLVPSW